MAYATQHTAFAGIFSAVQHFFAAIGNALVLVAESNPRMKKVHALQRMSDAELAERRAKWTAPEPRYERGYGHMYSKHVEQADKGCDFDFLRTEFGAAVPEPDIF